MIFEAIWGLFRVPFWGLSVFPAMSCRNVLFAILANHFRSFGAVFGDVWASFGGLWGCLLGPLGGFLGDCAGSWGRLGRPLDSKALRGRLWSDSREIPGDSWEPAGAHFGVILSFIVVSILMGF